MYSPSYVGNQKQQFFLDLKNLSLTHVDIIDYSGYKANLGSGSTVG